MTVRKIGALVTLIGALVSAAAAAQTTQSFFADRDTEIDNLIVGTACGASAGQGQAARIGVQPDKPTIYRTLLHFDLSSIPHNASITKADLHLYVEQLTQGFSFKIDVNRLTNPSWKEIDANWDVYDCDSDGTGPDEAFLWCMAGGDATTADGTAWWTSVAGDNVIPIISLVQKAVGKAGVTTPGLGGHVHLLLKAAQDTTQTSIERWVRVRTHEAAANPPRLEVTWTLPAGPTPTPAWVTFRDETSTRLNVQSCTELSPPRPLGETDRMEKDMAFGDFDLDLDQDIIIVR